VRDLDAACAALLRSGGTITVGPHEVPDDDRIVTAVDDQGTLFSLVAKIIR
jgi:predicted enzyme related to lactoylglutathione lyase